MASLCSNACKCLRSAFWVVRQAVQVFVHWGAGENTMLGRGAAAHSLMVPALRKREKHHLGEGAAAL